MRFLTNLIPRGKRALHKGLPRLFILFDYNTELIALIKQLDGAKWSQTRKGWYVEDSEENLQRIISLFKGIADINTAEVIVKEEKNYAITEPKPVVIEEKKPNTVSIEVIDYKKIILRFPFAKEHIAKIKTIPYYFWHKEEKYWSFSYTQNILSEIENYFRKFNYQIEIKNINTKGEDKKEKKAYGNERKLPVEYLEKLKLIRYSENTIRTYTVAFTDFINYYSKKDLLEISEEDIKKYLLYLVEKRKVSASYQNQVINAIKFYYEKVCGRKKLPYITIDRPFQDKILPTVLSEEEVMSSHLIVLDQMIGCFQDHRSRPVVLLHTDRPRIRIIRFKIKDILDIRPAPSVDRLVRISDDGDLAPRRGQAFHKPVLGVIRILILVDQDMLETVLPGLEDFGMFVEQDHGFHDEIAKITRLQAFHPVLIELINFSHMVLKKLDRLRGVLGRGNKKILGTLDLLAHSLRVHIFFTQLEFRDTFLDDLKLIILVIDDKIPVELHGGTVLAKNTKTCGMERAHPHPLGDKPLNTIPHFRCGFVRERNAEDVEGRNSMLDQVRDPVRKDTRLPASRTRQNKQRPDRRPGDRRAATPS